MGRECSLLKVRECAVDYNNFIIERMDISYDISGYF